MTAFNLTAAQKAAFFFEDVIHALNKYEYDDGFSNTFNGKMHL
jgi:hypothetical protein